MEQESEAEIVKAEIVEAEFVTPGNQSSGFFNRLLSKRSLDMMMFTGGGLLVAGFAVWLWSIGIFENALVLAASVGAANLLLVGAGLWMMTGAYRFTGRGILLLGSLVLPLNLWLYHSQELITIDSGYLWLPALIISAIYAGVARASRDPVFVFSFVGGVLLTGVLFAAGIAPTFPTTSLLIATLTVVVGAICIHVETLFPHDFGDFSKLRFGVAFFHSGISFMGSSFEICDSRSGQREQQGADASGGANGGLGLRLWVRDRDGRRRLLERGPRGRTDNAVRGQVLAALEGPHRGIRGRAERSVRGDAKGLLKASHSLAARAAA